MKIVVTELDKNNDTDCCGCGGDFKVGDEVEFSMYKERYYHINCGESVLG